MSNALAPETNDLDIKNEDGAEQYVTFQVADEVFGFPMASVMEIIRLPISVEVPLTPNALVGLANLRGSVLPILDLRRVLHLDNAEYNDATRVVVSDAGSPVGLVVDRVSSVMNVGSDRIDRTGKAQSSLNSEVLDGVIKGGEGEPLIQLLDVKSLISKEFAAIINADEKRKLDFSATEQESSVEEEDDDTDLLVSFTVENQEYAFHLLDVEEIVRIPETISRVPRSDNHVLGLIDLRDRLLPLVSLRRMFAMTETPIEEDNRILVVNLKRLDGRRDSVGLVVDDVKEVLRVSKDLWDTVPALLSCDDESNSISSICRLENGKRLVSVLRAESLFDHPVIQAAMEARDTEEDNKVKDNDKNLQTNEGVENDDTAQLVVFHLGEQEYGVSIDDVQEITRVPEKMDKVPKTEKFIEGMVNMRGTVLPVLDMRTRFDMEKIKRNDRHRIIVLNLNKKHTGFIVDSVAEVLRLPREQIETAPKLSEDQSRIMGQVVNLKEANRMIQVLAVNELLEEHEVAVLSEVE